MPNPYVSLLRTRGGPAMSAAGFVARLPLSMAGIALLLLVVQYTDSYAVGGSVQATWVIVEALVAPLVARLIDRVGQWQVVGPQTVLNLVFTTVLIGNSSKFFAILPGRSAASSFRPFKSM